MLFSPRSISQPAMRCLKRKRKRLRATLFYVASALVIGFLISPVGLMLLDTVTHSSLTIKDRNTEIIEAQAAVAAVLIGNTDLLLRISHYVNQHSDKGQVLCPVCSAHDSNKFDWPTEPDVPEPPICLPDTMDQLAKDADEIHSGVESTLHSLSLQENTLANFLRTLRLRSLD